MGIFKKLFSRLDNRKTVEKKHNPMLAKIIEEKREKGLKNFLSPHQVQQVINNNKDIDFLDDELKDMMNYPAIDFLAVKLMPELHYKDEKKDMSAEKVMSGAILGDIIGSHYEFTPHNYEEAFTENLPPRYSRFTDDTVLSIATMKAIKENRDNPDFRKHYIKAYNLHPNAGYGSAFISWARGESIDGKPIYNTKGYHSMANGCAMRVSYIAGAYDNIRDVIRHTISATITTHDHVEGVKNAVIISVCTWMALHNYTKEEIMQYCKRLYREKDMSKLFYGHCQYDIDSPTNTIPDAQTRDSLFANYAVPVAIRYFYETSSFEECMRRINSHFGDTDTICAIAGGLCMAYYGEVSLDIEKILHEHNVEKF